MTNGAERKNMNEGENIITLENASGDAIVKVAGKWKFNRNGEKEFFSSTKEAKEALDEIEAQGNPIGDIEIAYWGKRSPLHLTKENINMNKAKLYKLVKHYFAEGEICEIADTEYKRFNSRSGWLSFYSSDDIRYKASFDVVGGKAMLGINEIDPFKAEAGEKLFSKVYHPSAEIMMKFEVYKEPQPKL